MKPGENMIMTSCKVVLFMLCQISSDFLFYIMKWRCNQTSNMVLKSTSSSISQKITLQMNHSEGTGSLTELIEWKLSNFFENIVLF